MRPDPVVEFCLGLGAIVLALAVALLLAFPPSWLDRREAAFATFTNVSHLGEGSTVTENGYVRGTVVRIEAAGGAFRVHMKVQPGFRLAPGRALALEETNPLQAASLVVAGRCRLVKGEPLQAGCCPEAVRPAPDTTEERGLASCGKLPSLIDVALDTITQNKTRMDSLTEYVTTKLPPMVESTKGAIAATQTGMVALKAAADNGSSLMTTNSASLKTTLDSAKGAVADLGATVATIKQMLDDKRDQIDASITNASDTLANTAATMPGIVENLQKSAEDMRAITGQIRNEPTSLIRRRERSDPSFVEPAAGN